MEVACSFCGTLGVNRPNEDHDCAATLMEAAERTTAVVSADADWDSLSRDALFRAEQELAGLYKSLSDLTAYFSERIDEATRRRDGAYNRKQRVRASLNRARSVIRDRMEDAE